MKDLLTEYTAAEIIMFIVILAFAVKEVVSFYDWAADRVNKATDKNYKTKEEHKNLENQVAGLEKFYAEKDKVDKGFEEIHTAIEEMNKRIDMLVTSDKNDIKSYITEKHHFYIEQGWIDDYTMECLENRFAVYQNEHGNSFICVFMEELRKLPRKPQGA